jgi:amino acid adenylation domain-containing protein
MTVHLRAQTLTGIFAASVAAHADCIAVSDESGRRFSYAELDRESGLLAGALCEAGVLPGELVGILRPRDVDLMVSILGVLRAGAGYVVVDSRYPDERRDLMLRDAGVRLTVTQPEWLDRLAGSGPALGWSTAGESRSHSNALVPDHGIRPGDTACVIFTSGSTGTPKGVVVEHRNVGGFAANPGMPALRATDRVAQLANVSFDASHYEWWCTLAAGAELVIMPSMPELIRGDVGRELRRRRISVLLCPTMALNHIAVEDSSAFNGMRIVHAGGDVLRPSAVRDIHASGFTGSLFNLYGPTEASTAITLFDTANLDADAVTVPIGHAVAGTVLHILDERLRPVPPGEVGELYCGGAAVARGYLHDPAKTAQAFLPDPLGEPGATMYATGDSVRDPGNGELEYLGRADNQVKIRGYRVEPAEVERSLRRHPEVRDVVVLAAKAGQDNRLVAFVLPHDELPPHELRAFAEATIPDYHVPSEFVVLTEEFPATVNGKRDIDALQALLAERERGRGHYVEPENKSQRYLADVWESLLGIERIGADDDFFRLGGHSMLAFRVRKSIERDLGVEIALEDVLQNPVLAELAEAVDALLAEGTGRRVQA